MIRFNRAFTLAEVLITLGIIGIVAEMTIPTLMNNINDAQFKVAYKKSYSTLSQALKMAQANDELILCTDWTDTTCNNNNFNALKKYFKVTKDCGNDNASCWNQSGEKAWGSSYPTTDALSFIDASGTAWTRLSNAANGITGGEILLDTNGNKLPNQFGKDRAIFIPFYVVNTSQGLNYTTPMVKIEPDCDGTAVPGYSVAEQANRCPSYAKYPCYYTSLITGAK